MKLLAVAVAALCVSVGCAASIPTPSPEQVVAALFKALHIPADAQTCVTDVDLIGSNLRDFATDLKSKQYHTAIDELGVAMTGLATAVSGCDVPGVQTKIDALAAAVKFANISTQPFDNAVKVVVGAADLWTAVSGLAASIESGNPSAIGSGIGQLLNEWTAVLGGCGDSKACHIVDGILRILQVTASDISPCEAALVPAATNLTAAAAGFKSGAYKAAVADFASGLDAIALAVDSDSCGLRPLANVIVSVVPQLSAAIVKIENSNDVKIIVGSADLYDTLYQATMALEAGDLPGFGMQMGRLVQQLQASGCSTPACTVLQALLATAQIEATDFASCARDADNAWADLQAAASSFKSRVWAEAVRDLATGINTLADAVSDCGVPQLAKTIQAAAGKLGDSPVASEIGEAVQILVQGADVTSYVSQAVLDLESKSYTSFGNDLLNVVSFMSSTKCNSVVCKVVEGLLDVAGTAFHDLTACEADLAAAQSYFTTGGQNFEQKHLGDAVQDFATALNSIAKGVTDCGLQAELGFIEQEANVLGIANASIISEVGSVIVHGADFYQDVYGAVMAIEHHDYRSAGHDFATVMNQLSEWTQGHVCTDDFCYVVVGILQFMGDVEGSVKECENDFKMAWDDFGHAFHNFSDSHHWFRFDHDATALKTGVRELGDAFGLVAQGVSDCHLEEFAELLAKLAAKLGIAPEISWLEEVLHILIEGVDIEKEVSLACTDFSNDNWVGFGFNLAKLIKTLL